MLGELLEKCYIHSTDIEYSQFYMKELAILAENRSQLYKEEHSDHVLDIQKQARDMFEKIEMKKSQYFKENAKEMSGSEQILRSLNLNLKHEKDQLETDNWGLRQRLKELKQQLEQLAKAGEDDQKGRKRAHELENQVRQARAEIESQRVEWKQKEQDWRKRNVGLESEAELLRRKLEEVGEERKEQIGRMEAEMADMIRETEQIWEALREQARADKKGGERAEREREKRRKEEKGRFEEELEERNRETREARTEARNWEAKCREQARRAQEKEEELAQVERNLEEVENKFEELDKKFRENQRSKQREKWRQKDWESQMGNIREERAELMLEVERRRKENLDNLQRKNTEIGRLKDELEKAEAETREERKRGENKQDELRKARNLLERGNLENQNLGNQNRVLADENLRLKEKKETLEKAQEELEKLLKNVENELSTKLKGSTGKLEKAMTREKELTNELVAEKEKMAELLLEREKGLKLEEEFVSLKSKAGELCELLLKSKERIKEEQNIAASLKSQLESEKMIRKKAEEKLVEKENLEQAKAKQEFQWNLDKFQRSCLDVQKENSGAFNGSLVRIKDPTGFRIFA